jgi:hypothetical protein
MELASGAQGARLSHAPFARFSRNADDVTAMLVNDPARCYNQVKVAIRSG